MKRIISGIMAILLLLSLTTAAFGSEYNATDPKIFILSKPCPAEYIEYAEREVGNMFGNDYFSSPYLGAPFSFSNLDASIFYFPIFSEGKIVKTFRVYQGQDGTISGVLSQVFVEELNSIAQMTSQSNPLRISYESKREYDAIIFRLNNYELEVQTLPATSGTSSVATTSSPGFSVVCSKPTNQFQIAPALRSSTVLNMTITETQGSNSWCLAYCAAMVLRYSGMSSWTARKVMVSLHGENVSTKTSMGNSNFTPFMTNRGFRTEKYVSTSAGSVFTKIVANIDNNSPVVLSMHGTKDNEDVYHSIIALGYDNYRGTVTVWNPWYSFFETIAGVGNYVPAQSSTTYAVRYCWINNYRT